MRILVIKHGALGDIFQAFETFNSLRQHFASSHITLLTNSIYRGLAQCSPWFDDVLIDDRPPLYNWRHLMWIRCQVRYADYVFDLQSSNRTRFYFHISGNKNWSGKHTKACMPHVNPQRHYMHTLTRQHDQLRSAGVPLQPRSIPNWLTHKGLVLKESYCVLVAGAASHRPAKCWPIKYFSILAHWLSQQKIRPIIIGEATHYPLGEVICSHTPQTLNLMGKTTLPELSGLLHRALFAVGNDTGPMHIAATMDCPTLTLFSHTSDPRRCAPLALTSGYTHSLSTQDLNTLSPTQVCHALSNWIFPLLEQRKKIVQNHSNIR